jgi:molecular chaperone HtpG
MDPFDVVDLHVPEAGVRGVAYVLPYAANVAGRGGHRVHLKRMLLTENAEGLLPEWAFFVRCVVDATELRPTASREALYDDGLLTAVREQLGTQIRDWLVRLANHQPARLASFLDIHHLGVKALAVHDDEMLRLVDRFWPMETNVGQMTLAEFRERYGAIRYAATNDQFRQLAAVAAAQHLPVVNGGFTYDAQLIARLSQLDPEIAVERLDPSELATRLEPLDLAAAAEVAPFLAVAQRHLDRLGCEVVVRAFHPDNLAALYLVDKDAEFRAELRATKEKSDPLWASVLGALDSTVSGGRPQLVLNYRSAIVRRIMGRTEPEVVELAVESLYGRALLRGYHPIRPADAELLDRSFLGLLDRAFP